jgi:hypothetical protein
VTRANPSAAWSWREAWRAAHVQPLPDLLHAHALLRRRHADAAEHCNEIDAQQSDQRRSRRRDIALERLFLMTRAEETPSASAAAIDEVIWQS